MKTTQHTPLPWHVEKDHSSMGRYACLIVHEDQNKPEHRSPIAQMEPYAEMQANAQFIVTACNAHYELLEALKAAQRFFDVLREHYQDVFEFNSNDADGLLDWDVQMKIQDAIAKAKEQP